MKPRTCPAAATRTVFLLLLSSLPGAFIHGVERDGCQNVFSSSPATAATKTMSSATPANDPASLDAVAPKKPLFRRLPTDAARHPRPTGAPTASLQCDSSDSEPECRDGAAASARGAQEQ